MKVTGVRSENFIYIHWFQFYIQKKGFLFKKSTTGQFSELFGKHPVQVTSHYRLFGNSSSVDCLRISCQIIPKVRAMEYLKKSAAAVSCLCNLGPYLLAIVAFRSVSTNMNQLPPRFIGQVMIQQEHLGPPQSQAVIPQLGQATSTQSAVERQQRTRPNSSGGPQKKRSAGLNTPSVSILQLGNRTWKQSLAQGHAGNALGMIASFCTLQPYSCLLLCICSTGQ